MKFPPSKLALKWCGPPKKGLEVGGSGWNDFFIDALNVAPDDPQDREFYAKAHAEMLNQLKAQL